MRHRTPDLYPIIEKTITLPEEDRAGFHRAFVIDDRIKESILELLIAAQTKVVDREEAIWKEIAQRLGFDNLAAIQAVEKAVSISWATGVVTLRSKAKDDERGAP